MNCDLLHILQLVVAKNAVLIETANGLDLTILQEHFVQMSLQSRKYQHASQLQASNQQNISNYNQLTNIKNI